MKDRLALFYQSGLAIDHSNRHRFNTVVHHPKPQRSLALSICLSGYSYHQFFLLRVAETTCLSFISLQYLNIIPFCIFCKYRGLKTHGKYLFTTFLGLCLLLLFLQRDSFGQIGFHFTHIRHISFCLYSCGCSIWFYTDCW